jgi:hypothetical protein
MDRVCFFVHQRNPKKKKNKKMTKNLVYYNKEEDPGHTSRSSES